jgi:hypothetical protein
VDGTRYLCLINDAKVYFIDRKSDVFCAKIFYNLSQAYDQTLFDGELVRGRDNCLHFVVFDTLVVSGRPVMKNRDFLKRLHSVQEILDYLNASQQNKVRLFIMITLLVYH